MPDSMNLGLLIHNLRRAARREDGVATRWLCGHAADLLERWHVALQVLAIEPTRAEVEWAIDAVGAPAGPGEPLRDREHWGRRVREIWIAFAAIQPNPKPSWLMPWDELSERDREVDRRIGETIAAEAHVAGHLAVNRLDLIRDELQPAQGQSVMAAVSSVVHRLRVAEAEVARLRAELAAPREETPDAQ